MIMSYSNPANINIIATENALNQNSNELAAELLIGFALNCENRDELEALCQKILVDTPLEIQCAAILA